MFDDPGRKLRWMERELAQTADGDFLSDFDPELLEELELTAEDLAGPQRRGPDFSRAVYDDEAAASMAYVPPGKKEKGIGGLVFLAALELTGILLILGWWFL